MKSFLFEVGEWFADVKDNLQLFWLDQKIKSLNEEFEEEFSSVGRREIVIWLELYSKAYNKIRDRVRARDARHQRAVAH